MKSKSALAVAAASLFAAGAATAQTTESSIADAWAMRATLYGWFPDARANSAIALPGGGTVSLDTDPGSYLSQLDFALMGTFEARKGPWSFVADAVYVDFGHGQSNLTALSGPIGPVDLPVPVDLRVDVTAFVTTLAGGYAVSQMPGARIDAVAGARYLHLNTSVDWKLSAAPPGVPTQGSRSVTKDYWDGVVGVRGRSEFGQGWFASYYADVGTGASSVTWQAFAAVGYRFKWGDALVGYRYLAYEFKDGEPLSDLRLGGPLVGIGFSF